MSLVILSSWRLDRKIFLEHSSEIWSCENFFKLWNLIFKPQNAREFFNFQPQPNFMSTVFISLCYPPLNATIGRIILSPFSPGFNAFSNNGWGFFIHPHHKSQPVARMERDEARHCAATSCSANWAVGLKNCFMAWDDKMISGTT